MRFLLLYIITLVSAGCRNCHGVEQLFDPVEAQPVDTPPNIDMPQMDEDFFVIPSDGDFVIPPDIPPDVDTPPDGFEAIVPPTLECQICR
jgi:hypothetical protein